MMDITPTICVFLVIFLNFPPMVAAMSAIGCDGTPIVSRCSEPVDTNLYEHLAVLNKATYAHTTNCYFLVKGASYLVQQSNGEKVVDLNRARKICDEHDAFLPNVLSEHENEFLTNEFYQVTPFVLLGLQRATYQDYIWDNLHGPAFKPKVWKVINETTSLTYTLLSTRDGHWIGFYPNQTWSTDKNALMPPHPPIICQQRGYGPLGDSFSDARGNWVPSAANCSRDAFMVRRRTRGNNAHQQSYAQTTTQSSLFTLVTATITILTAFIYWN